MKSPFPQEQTVTLQNGQEVSLVYDLAGPSDVDEAFELMVAHFFTRAPQSQIYFDEGSKEPKWPSWRLDDIRRSCTPPDGCSITAREKTTGRLVAFSACQIMDRNSWICPPPPSGDRSPGWRARAIKYQIVQTVDPFVTFNVERVGYVSNGVVHSDYGQSGLLAQLVALASLELLSRGIETIVAGTTSDYAIKLALKAESQVLGSFRFDAVELPDGTKPFAGVDMGVHQETHFVGRNLKSLVEELSAGELPMKPPTSKL